MAEWYLWLGVWQRSVDELMAKPSQPGTVLAHQAARRALPQGQAPWCDVRCQGRAPRASRPDPHARVAELSLAHVQHLPGPEGL